MSKSAIEHDSCQLHGNDGRFNKFYPFDVKYYVVTYFIDDTPRGVYRFSKRESALDFIDNLFVGGQITKVCLNYE